MLHAKRNPKMPAFHLSLSFSRSAAASDFTFPSSSFALHGIWREELRGEKNACRIHFLSKEREVFETFQHQQPYTPSPACSPLL